MAVVEIARISVRPEAKAAFEAAFPEAHELVRAAPGHLSSVLSRSIEGSGYVFLVHWNSLADHVEHFAVSAEFQRFGGLIAPYFASDPDVEHFQELGAPA